MDQPVGLATQYPGEFLQNDLDDLLSRVQCAADLSADGALADPV